MPKSPISLRYIFDSATFNSSEALIDNFRKLYEEGFPDANEREEYPVILQRVKNKPSVFDPYTFLILACNSGFDKSNKVFGGIIADWYEHCKSIHLTYIVVSPEARGKQIGKLLITTGLSEVKKIILKHFNIQLKSVIFESNMPWRTKIDSFDPETRLNIFRRLNAKWIDIPYVQPALDKTKSKVDNLFLLTFPELNESKEYISRTETIEFLYDLYKGLGVDDPDQDPDYKIMSDILSTEADQNLLLIEIPANENIRFNFSKTSLAIHLVENREKSANDEIQQNCNHFHSYETDLMNFQNQKIRPFSTRLLKHSADCRIKIVFPEMYGYISEGRIETRHSVRPSVDARLSLSYTYFDKTGTRIWHLVVSPVEDDYFTEYDLIKLISYFGSVQECSDINENIRFNYNESEELTIEDLLHIVSGMEIGELIYPGSGVVQIESSEVELTGKKGEINWKNFYAFLVIAQNRNNSLLKLEKKVDVDENMFEFLKVICGFILGIFDFERMGIEEIEDTVTPIEASDSYYTVMSRGNLLCIGHEEEMMDSVYDTIGINPYLLVPGALLTYYDHILNRAVVILDKTLNEINQEKVIDLGELSETRRRAEHHLNNLLPENVFQYPTEKEIFNSVIVQRQIDSRKANIRSKINELTDIIDTKGKLLNAKAQGVISLLLIILSCIGLYARFEGLLKSPLLTWAALIVFTIPVSILVYKKTVSQK